MTPEALASALGEALPFLDRGLIRRIAGEAWPKYKKDKERLKAARRQLHIDYGTFYPRGIHAEAESLIEAAQEDWARRIMALHVSTRERLGYVKEFYLHLREVTGGFFSVMDLGCGFNPFALSLMGGISEYHAWDVDTRTAALVNRFLETQGLPPGGETIDLVAQTPAGKADAAFLFKLLPILENARRGRARSLIDGLEARWLIITFPTKSLGGRNVGMAESYTRFFDEKIALEPVSRRIIGDELIYILRKEDKL